MDVLETLSVALGLATLAGINLYLTVFAAGLAVHFGWVALPQSLHELHALGEPWVLVVAGVLYLFQFFADKIPWIDTANDALHSFIRPLGGAMLAVLALGDADPRVKVIAALLAGGAALTAHTAKAGTRLIANASPEPVSNIGLSLGEDAVVLGGLGLMVWNPVVLLVVAVVTLVVIWLVIPRLLRSANATVWLAWRKLNSPSAGHEVTGTPRRLPGPCELALRRAHATTDPVVLAVRCLSGTGPRLPRNHFGWLARFQNGRVFFVSPKWRSPLVVEVPHEAPPERESLFLSEKLVIRGADGAANTFYFERGHRLLADHVAEVLSKPVSPVEAPVAAV
ncbi:MAG TPA: DUF4126 domain-containing protein [Terrimicrobiaceae bacterium]|nr:DUF4126 domain-containing protein [Terrimicrobiaceae bacterium]